MPAYKLYYFALRARGEPIRLAFAAAGVGFEDVRITFDDWPNHKPKMPFRQMPVLEVDGKQLSQSYTIVRYLANEFGLAGKDKWEAAEVDQYTGATEDIFAPVISIYFNKDETSKAEALNKYKEQTAPSVFGAIENRLSKSSSGYLVGDGLTYADLCLLNLVEIIESTLKEVGKEILAPYPSIQKHRETIASVPKIAAYIKTRPASDI